MCTYISFQWSTCLAVEVRHSLSAPMVTYNDNVKIILGNYYTFFSYMRQDLKIKP